VVLKGILDYGRIWEKKSQSRGGRGVLVFSKVWRKVHDVLGFMTPQSPRHRMVGCCWTLHPCSVAKSMHRRSRGNSGIPRCPCRMGTMQQTDPSSMRQFALNRAIVELKSCCYSITKVSIISRSNAILYANPIPLLCKSAIPTPQSTHYCRSSSQVQSSYLCKLETVKHKL
jgi:hypothetical protein